ncbi:MAG: iron ABC transporter permease [Azoarcus sp.]|jgi:iron complex transport system permease protein|nr:iron ABC transporter permease [Azoarcus sp.]
MAEATVSCGASTQPGWRLPALLAFVLVAAVVISLGFGAYPMSFGDSMHALWRALWPWAGGAPTTGAEIREWTVVTVIRPPRILVATFSGIALGLTGTALQGMMRNPLVGPDLVGVSSGAAFGGVLALIMNWPVAAVVACATVGGVGAMLCTLALARLVSARNDGVALILAGFFVGAFFLAGVGLLKSLPLEFSWKLPGIVYWLLGSFRGADPVKVWVIAVPTVVGFALLMGLRWRLNLLSLGDVDAASLGVDVRWLRWAIIAIVSVMVAAQVAVSGVVGWVGLIIPHCARMLVGPDHRRLIPASALLGGLYVLALDNLTRTVTGGEIPVGVLSAFFGTPMLCFLFWKTQTKGWNE